MLIIFLHDFIVFSMHEKCALWPLKCDEFLKYLLYYFQTYLDVRLIY
jgi:hypothetical protein